MSGLLATQGVTPTADEVAVSLNGASARAGAEHVLVPLCLELIADLETPVSAFLKLRAHMYAPGAGAPSPPLPPPLPLKPPGAAGTRAFLLESVEGGERLARYSIVGFDPRDAIVSGTDGGSGDDGDPLAAVEAWLAKQQVVVPPVLRGQLPAGFTGGAVGYVGYDAVRHWEPRTARALGAQVDALGIPEAAFLLCDDLLVFDHVRHTIKIVAHMRMEAGAGGAPHLSRTIIDAAHAAACSRIAAICERLAGPLPARDGGAPTSPVPLRRTGGPSAATVAAGTGEGLASVAAVATGAEAAAPPPAVDCDAASNMGRTGYEGAVRSLKEHIVAGNIIQAVPSHRVECALPPRVSAFDVYRHLRIINPSPYMFYLDLGPDFQIVGASPEMLVKVTADGSVQTHPIAGTRPRGATPEEDDKLAVSAHHCSCLFRITRARSRHRRRVHASSNPNPNLPASACAPRSLFFCRKSSLPTPRSAPSTSCLWTLAATTSGAWPLLAVCEWRGSCTSKSTRMCNTS